MHDVPAHSMDKQSLTVLSPEDIRQLSLQEFTGPFDLLLALVRKKEVEILDINLSEITAEYLRCLEVMDELSIEVSGEFLAMASVLVYIKSRRLLPDPEPDDDDIDDDPTFPRTEAELLRRLLELQRFQLAADDLLGRPILERDTFARPTFAQIERGPVAAPTTLVKLASAYRRVIQRHTPTVLTEQRVRIMSIPAAVRRVARLLRRMASGGPFRTLVSPEDSRGDIVQLFCTVLELARWGYVGLEQDTLGGASLEVRPGDRKLELAAMDEVLSVLAPE